MNNNRRDIVVIGGGISGLTVAWHLRRAGRDVALLEAQHAVGGAMQTEQRDGFLLEKGPFNVIVRAPEFEYLLSELSPAVKVVTADDAAKKRYLYRHGGIHAVPTNPVGLFATPLLTKGGALRAMRGLCLSRRGDGSECTLAEFATRRFGREVADTLLSAVVAGIFAGDIYKLSAYACFPVLEEFDRHSHSPMGRTLRRVPQMIRKRRNPALQRRWKGLVSIDRGLGGLAQALGDTLGDNLWTSTQVGEVTRDDDGWQITATRNGAPVTLTTRHLILATPAHEAARLIRPHTPAAADLCDTIDSASLTVINMAFPRDTVRHPLDGFGFLVPQNEPDFPLMGVLFADSAFPHHAPPDQRLLRVFMGGSRTPDIIARSDDELIATARAGLRDTLGVTGQPTLIDICAYPSAIPQYYLGHRERVADLRRHVAELPGLHLAGNYLDGVSINDCVKQGQHLAEALLAETGEPH